MPLYWPFFLVSSFPHISRLWNGNVESTRILALLTQIISFIIRCLSISHLVLVDNYKLTSHLTPPFSGSHFQLSWVCSTITFLARVVIAHPLHMTLTLGRIDCVTSQRNVCVWGNELGLLFYASPLSLFLSFRQSVVHVLYLVRALYPVRSSWSAVHILYWPVCDVVYNLISPPAILRREDGEVFNSHSFEK